MALSQKIFGTTVVTVADENVAINPVPTGETPTTPIDNTVPAAPVTENPTVPSNDDPVVKQESDPKDVVITDTPPTKPVEEPKTPEEKPVVSVKITQTLKKGSKGPEVIILQEFLIEGEYLTGKADGSFGPMTETAVKKFQTEYKLTADGIVGGNTRTTINEILASN